MDAQMASPVDRATVFLGMSGRIISLKNVQQLLLALPFASGLAMATDYTVDFSRIDNLESIRPLVQQCGDFDALVTEVARRAIQALGDDGEPSDFQIVYSASDGASVNGKLPAGEYDLFATEDTWTQPGRLAVIDASDPGGGTGPDSYVGSVSVAVVSRSGEGLMSKSASGASS